MQLYCMQLAPPRGVPGGCRTRSPALAKLNNTRKARQVIAEAARPCSVATECCWRTT